MSSCTPLKALLVEGGIKQRWLAERVGIHESEISNIVKGKDPGEDRARAIAEALRQTCTDLGWPHHDPDHQAAA
jgi:transcriptional regulator with XRE-family HTH domain